MTDAEGRHITIRVSQHLREAIKDYAHRHGVTVTQLTLDYYRRLLEAENKQDAEQA